MFLQSSIRLASRSFKSSSGTYQSVWRKLSTNAIRTPVQSTRNASVAKLGLAIGATSTLILHSHSKILNEVASMGSFNTNLPTIDTNAVKRPVHSRFGGKLHYKQLSYGSLTGLFLGVIIGKLSSLFAFVALSIFLAVQFLQTRGIIRVQWTSFVKVGSDRIDVRKLVLEDPSFKISFALTFLIAAFNI